LRHLVAMYLDKERAAKSAVPSSRNRDLLWGLLLLAATLFAYQPCWNGQPVWDDDINLIRPELRSSAGLVRIWTQLGATQQYYPLAYSVFWLEHHLWGASTLGYHLLNILLHVFSALLIVKILRRLDIPGEAAWLAAGIFALHPVMVESVAWMTELKNTLSGAFYCGAALAYLEFDNKRETKHYSVALLFFLLGLLTKSAIVTLPAALLVVFWWKRGRLAWRRDTVPLLPFIAVGLIAGLLTAWIERRFVGATGSEFSFTAVDRCLIAGRAVWFYLLKLLFPVDLVLIYPRWHIDAAAAWQYLFPGAILLAAVLFWRQRHRSRAPLAVLLYFVVTLLPSLGFINVNYFRFSFVADHFQYLACIGPFSAAAAGIIRGNRRLLSKELRRTWQPFLFSTLLTVLSLLSWKQSGMYSDAETLFRATVTRNTNCWLAHNNLGRVLADTGRTDEAVAHFQKAVEINPTFGEAHFNLGVLVADMGRTDEAVAHYRKAVEFDPDHADAHNNLGVLLEQMGQADEAMALYRKTLEINPNHSGVHNNLGILLARLGRRDEAMAHYRRALEIDPNAIDPLQNLAFSLVQKGQRTDAILAFERALQLAKSTGDEARAKMFAQILADLNDAIGSAKANPKTQQ
jgi:protein O-mannosyl-transferase